MKSYAEYTTEAKVEDEFTKKAKTLIAKVEKITKWRGGKDESDSASDLIRMSWSVRQTKPIDSIQLQKLTTLLTVNGDRMHSINFSTVDVQIAYQK